MFAIIATVAPYFVGFYVGAIAMLFLIDILHRSSEERDRMDRLAMEHFTKNEHLLPIDRNNSILNYDKM